MQRVSVYVDGFNLYYGLKSKGWRRYYWLDLRRLSENLLRPGQRLAMVRYFTTKIAPRDDDLDQQVRQDIYLQALRSHLKTRTAIERATKAFAFRRSKPYLSKK